MTPFFCVRAAEVSLNFESSEFQHLIVEQLESVGLGLYDLSYNSRNQTLQLFVFDPETGNAVIEDCVKANKVLDEFFEEDKLPDNFVLEVSSPGAFRSLKTIDHFKMATGQRVKLNFRDSATKAVTAYEGTLSAVKGEVILIDTENSGRAELSFNDITKAKLDPQF